MVPGIPTITFELQLRFAGDAPAAAAAKRAVLAELAARGITEYAEGVIDGVDDPLGTEDPEAAFAPAEQDRTPVLVFGYDRAALDALGAALVADLGAAVEARLVALATEAWSQAWDESQAPLVTERFAVQPVGWPGAAPAGRAVLRLHPGEAFGSGRHATTQVALEALERLPAGHPRHGFLDVGTGNGVLALAATRLGFDGVVGTEIDAAALAEARANAALNGVTLELHLADAPPDDGRRFAVVAANILVPVLHRLLPRLAARVADGGTLLLAGFIDKEATPLLAAAGRLGLALRLRHECRGWVALGLTWPAGRP